MLNSNLQFVLFGCILFGISSAVLGSFAFLRKRALLGDAIAHAVLPGVCIAFLLTHSKHPLYLIIGASTTGLLGSLFVSAITQKSRIKEDTAIGLVLSVFFGIGILLLTHIQHQPLGNQSGLDKFLFGQAASLIRQDVMIFGALALFLLAMVALCYKEFKLISFDPDFAKAIGINVWAFDTLLTTLIVLVVSTGLQAVGVVLMAAMLITPAAAARQWTDRLGTMLVLAAFFGASSGVFGALISTVAPRMPTGPWIVVAITTFFTLSLLFAPKRGIVSRWFRHRRHSFRIQYENILLSLIRFYEDGEKHVLIDHIRRYRHFSSRRIASLLKKLQSDGLACHDNEIDRWTLTDAGIRQGSLLLRRHRLWELYLSRHLHLDNSQVHDDAENIEHIITPELEAELMAMLDHPTVDPHNQPIDPLKGGRS